jgi:hypothetical protein
MVTTGSNEAEKLDVKKGMMRCLRRQYTDTYARLPNFDIRAHFRLQVELGLENLLTSIQSGEPGIAGGPGY